MVTFVCFRLSGKSYQANPIKLVQEEYNFTYPKRGTAVIINNRNFDQERTGQSDRDGTDVDAAALESVFIKMGFDVVRHDNVNRMDMMLAFRRCKEISIILSLVCPQF